MPSSAHRTTQPSVEPKRRWASITDTAEHLGVAERTVRQMIADGRLTGYQLSPKFIRLDLDEVDAAMRPFGGSCGCTGHHLAGRRVEHADPTDGLLDMTMINSASRSRLIRLFPTVFRGTHVDLDTVSTRRATTITVECPGISAYADGDFACTLPAEISVAREALRMLCPAGN